MPRMVFLSRESLAPLSAEEAKEEALRYSNLCKIQYELIKTQEAQLKKMAEELGANHQLVLFAKHQLDQLKDKVYGSSSERRAGTEGLPLFDAAEEEKEEITYKRKKRTQFGRTPQPELPRVEILHELPAEEVQSQGLEKMEGQYEESELVNVVPSKFQLEIHKRQKYRQKAPEIQDPEKPFQNDTIVTAPGVLKLKEGSRYSIEFALTIGLNKYRWHMPLDRQVRMMASQGLICTSQVLYGQVDTVAWYLQQKLIPKLVEEIHNSKMHQGDETYWENLAKNAKSRFWLWSVTGGRATLFEVFDSRSKKVAKKFLGKLKGILLTDGFQGYACLANELLILANDWCHVRRKFLAAEKTHPAESLFFLNQIRLLFEIEERIQGLSSEEKFLIRQSESKPITDIIYAKCIEFKNVLPKSPLGRAIQYTLKLWKGLTVFLEHPEVPIHTNTIERAQRSPVLGRKNHYGSKTLDSAQIAAIWYSVLASCELNQVEPYRYLLDTMQAILAQNEVLTPWEWKEKQKSNAS
jgi:transposase